MRTRYYALIDGKGRLVFNRYYRYPLLFLRKRDVPWSAMIDGSQVVKVELTILKARKTK